jgi:hypothetical protein
MMTGFEQYTKKTRPAIFLEEMEQVVPWRDLCALIEPHYPQPGKGRPLVEPVFGVLKQQQRGMRQFCTCRRERVICEFTLAALGYQVTRLFGRRQL